jgi:hypothetical protein
MTVSRASTSQSSPLLVDPTSVIIDAIAKLDPLVNRVQLTALIAEVAPQRARRGSLAEQLEARPDLLTGAGAHGSPAVIKLIEGLTVRRVTGVVAPACPFCTRRVALPRGRDELRCCKSCWNAVHGKPCDRCGKVGRIDRRTNDGAGLCAACCRTEPSLQETCNGCDRLAVAARRDGNLVFCKNCCTPLTMTCSHCGRMKPCYYADTDAPRCKNCSDKLRAQPCVECGQQRVIHRRTASGDPLCKECGSMGTCTKCQRTLPIRFRSADMALCQSCYKNDAASRRTCVRCGTVDRLHHFGLCPACAWPDVVRKLLTAPEGTLRAELEPVLTTLSAIDANTGLSWVARVPRQNLLSTLATGTGPVTHQVLDQLAPASDADHLRALLVDHAVLPPRDERLIGLERAINRRIARVDNPAERRILRSYGTWRHLRRLRTLADRQPITADQVVYACNALTAAAGLLNWLQERGQTLATCAQDDIDDWLTIDTFSRSHGFVTWAVSCRHAHNIQVPPFNNQPVREVFANRDQRWSLARQLLHGDSITLPDRVAGLLVLLYAQRATRITQLTTGNITITDNGVELLLGKAPITVPDAFGDLLEALVNDRRATTIGSQDEVWLYPAPQLRQPLAPRSLLQRLRTLGIPATLGRNTALMEMAGEMPAAVITKLLGISLHRATRWTQDAGNTRPSYATQIARRGTP